MKRLPEILLAVLAALAFTAVISSCGRTGGPATVEHPFILAASMGSTDIVKVELTDSLTAVTMYTKSSPHSWVRWGKDTKILADGIEYAIKGGEGMTPGEYIWTDDKGDVEYTLFFEPVPFRTKSIDISEGYTRGCFNFYGIDLTGRAKERTDRRMPAPAALKAVPVFNEGMAESTVNVHVLNLKPGMDSTFNWEMVKYIGYASDGELKVDPDGNASLTFKQKGTGFFTCVAYDAVIMGATPVEPGETVDLYIDVNESGHNIMKRREGYVDAGARYSSANGKLSALSGFKPLTTIPEDFVTDWRVSAEEYCDALLAAYGKCMEEIDASGAKDTDKELSRLLLKGRTLELAGYSLNVLAPLYVNSGEDVSKANSSMFASCGKEDIKRVLEAVGPVDISDMDFLSRSVSPVDFAVEALIDYDLIPENDREYDRVHSLFGWEKALNGKLEESDCAELDKLGWDFPAKALRSINDDTLAALSEGAMDFTAVSEWDGVQEWMESILKPHAGKVVMIDLWDTWCAPCKSALAQTEPQKSGILSSDDIVWIYIADDSSPILEYKEAIKEISGIHYRLDEDRINELRRFFGVDGIPFYILVERDGSFNARPDLRNHDLFVKELLDRTEE